jgi:hypothetical protein
MAGAPDAAYYQQVEEFFVGRRGDPLFLSNADWTLVHKWKIEGLPLRVVLRGIGDALDAHAHSWGREHKVGSIRYCAAEVDVARERWLRALAGPGGEEAGVSESLLALADALERAPLRAGAGQLAEEIARDLRARAGGAPERRDVEPWLARSEARLVQVLRRDEGADVVAGLEAEVDQSLAPYRQRMPERILQQIRADAIARRLLEKRGLPRLSLVLT